MNEQGSHDQQPEPASDTSRRRRPTWLLPVAVLLLAAGCASTPTAPTTPTVTSTETTTQRSEGQVKIDLLMQMLNGSSSATLRALSQNNAILYASIVCDAATPTRNGRAALVMRSSTLNLADAYAFVDTAVSAYC